MAKAMAASQHRDNSVANLRRPCPFGGCARTRFRPTLGVMSTFEAAEPLALSRSLESLVAAAATGVVTLKAAAYRSSSGIVLPNGLIAAAAHVVRREERILVRSQEGPIGEATVVGRDGDIDLAILRLPELSLQPLKVAAPETLKPGALAAVVGMTPDVGPSVSLGILGAVGNARSTWRGGRLDRFLRLDVNLYPSQSGAAVVNASGELIGMATPALSRQSTLAIPAETLTRLAEQIARDGGLRRGYIGVGVQPVAIQPSVATRLNLQAQHGLLLVSVEDGSPADTAGLQLGDVLISTAAGLLHSPEDLQSLLRTAPVGKEIAFTIIHGGELETRSVVVGERITRSK